MPLFCVTGGFAHTVVVDRWRARGESYAAYLSQRVRRFVGPLSTFVLLVWLQDRSGAATLTLLLGAAFAVDAWAFAYWPHDPATALDIRHLNIVFVWLFCHQLGIAYARGWWRTWPIRALAVVSIGGSWLLVGPGPYPYLTVGFGDRVVSNLLPPTAAMGLLCLAQTTVLALVNRRDWPPAQKVLGLLNALLMTIYLWHVPSVSVGMGAWLLLSPVLGVDSWWASAAIQLAVGLPVLALGPQNGGGFPTKLVFGVLGGLLVVVLLIAGAPSSSFRPSSGSGSRRRTRPSRPPRRPMRTRSTPLPPRS